MLRAKRFLLATLALIALGGLRRVYANPIFVDQVSNSAFASATSVTWTHNLSSTTSCPNSLLIATCGNDAGTMTLTAGGVSMTQKVTDAIGTASIFTLSQSTTSGNLTMVMTNNSALNCYCSAISLCNVSSFTFLDATNNAAASSTNPNITIVIKSSGSWVIDDMWNEGATLTTQPTTNRNAYAQLQNSGNSNLLAHYEGPVKTTGTYTMQWTEATSTLWSKAVMSVLPSSGTPTVTTENTTSIGNTTATGNGQILRSNGYAITQEGVCVSSTNALPTTSDTCVTGSGTPFTASLTGLQANTKYYARAYGTNSQGTEYGDMIPFLTTTPTKTFVTTGSGSTKISTGGGSASVR